MAQQVIQHAFHSGEWNPILFARVDLQKYRAGAARLRNFYVDYRGGASTRPGTRYVNRCFKSNSRVRLIPFQPTSTTSYVLEFGDGYIRFHSNGAPVLEAGFTSGFTNVGLINAPGNNYVAGDWVFIGGQYFIVTVPGNPTFHVSDLWGNTGVTPPGGPTVARVYTLASPFAATDLHPNPFTGNPGVKFVQAVQQMILCHPSYQPQVLTILAPNNWTITTINFGPTISPPTGVTLTTNLPVLASGWNYEYAVTSVDANGQESLLSSPGTLFGYQNLQTQNTSNTTGATITLSWTAVPNAVSYNVYKASPLFNTVFPNGTPGGFIANTHATSFVDASPGIGPDFAQGTPVPQNPFLGAGVISYNVTAAGSYTTVPSVSVGAPTVPGGTPATASASLGALSLASVNLGNVNNFTGADPNGSYLTFSSGVTALITSTTFIGTFSGGPTGTLFAWGLNSFVLGNAGGVTGAGNSVPSNPMSAIGCSVTGFWSFGSVPTANVSWGVTQVTPIVQGNGYNSAPSVTFSAGAATATAILGSLAAGFPGVPGFFQERLAFAGFTGNPLNFQLSDSSNFFNFNIHDPVEPSDSISGTIWSGELNDIKSLTPVPTGLLVLSGKLAWILNGGGGLSAYNPITPANAVANPQAFSGSNDLQPLKINQDILYVTNKGSYVRDLNYNIYANVFTGTDISVISSHLFFNHFIFQWAWAEEPFKTAWCCRDDGTLLSLAYVKDQDTIGWGRHDTNGQFASVTTVLEIVEGNTVDAVYVVVLRNINGQQVQYVERLTDRYFTYGYEDSWSVDAGLQTVPQVFNKTGLIVTGNASVVGNTVTLIDNTVAAAFTAAMATNNWIVRAGGGIYKITAFTSINQVTATVVRVPTLINAYTGAAFTSMPDYGIWQPVTTITNLFHLQGQAVTGVADGAVVSGTVSGTGTLALGLTATKVTLGLAFTPQLQTLPIDLGSVPTVQGKPKVIVAASVRCADTLGLSIGKKFTTLVPMKDLVLGNLNYYLNAPVTDLVNADSRTLIDSTWDIPGQYCIQQSNPYPATILGVIPEFASEGTR